MNDKSKIIIQKPEKYVILIICCFKQVCFRISVIIMLLKSVIILLFIF